jgi:ArsR family transcriptional regulator
MDQAKLLRVLKALADPKRFRMLQEVAAAGELTCGEVGHHSPLSQPTISHHIKILTDAGLILVRESGQHHFISANLDLIAEVAAFLPGQIPAPDRSPDNSSPARGKRKSVVASKATT